MRIIPFILSVLLLFSSSCTEENKQPEIDDQLIVKYLADHQLNAVRYGSGLYMVTTQEGTGDSPTISNTVEVKYRGMLLNGTVFDQTEPGKTFTYELSGLILGWQIGIPMMKRGGKATLIVPSALGYGNIGIGPIPANSVLIFEIELVDFK